MSIGIYLLQAFVYRVFYTDAILNSNTLNVERGVDIQITQPLRSIVLTAIVEFDHVF